MLTINGPSGLNYNNMGVRRLVRKTICIRLDMLGAPLENVYIDSFIGACHRLYRSYLHTPKANGMYSYGMYPCKHDTKLMFYILYGWLSYKEDTL